MLQPGGKSRRGGRIGNPQGKIREGKSARGTEPSRARTVGGGGRVSTTT